jgi:2-oxoglutarate ferredoxin oxidoreductase subunit gamma
MAGTTQIRLSGFGGQGIVLAGRLLGHAGVIEKKYVCGSDAYGAQARGSGCKSELVFSKAPIDFPHLIRADILVAMSQQAYQEDCEEVRKPSGLIFYDPGQVTPRQDLNVSQFGIPATEYAVKKLKDRQVANLILVGSLVEKTGIVSPGTLRKAIRSLIPPRFSALNLEAFRIGMELGRKTHG